MNVRRTILTLAALSVVAACDSGPSGPGTLSATVSGPASLGAVLLEVTGAGVQGFVGQGGTRVYGAQVSAVDGTHRVLALTADGGPLRVGIEVLDLGAEPPIVMVLKAASTENLMLLNAGVTVVVAKP
jgi:hypothetical protein